MKRSIGRSALAALALLASPSAGHASAPKSPDYAALQAGLRAAQTNDCKGALKLMAPVLRQPQVLPDEPRAAADAVAALCALRVDQTATAYGYALDGTALQVADDELWRIRLGIELDQKKTDAALETVTRLTEGRGAALNGMPVRWLLSLDNNLRDAGNAVGRRRLLAILTEPNYLPNEAVPVADLFRQRYAEVLYDAGEKDAALGLVARIETPSELMALSVDSRFRAAVPASFDARKALGAWHAKLKALAPLHPDSLDLVIEMAAAQRQMGQPEAALETLKASDPTAPGARRYGDKDQKLNWWWDGIARAHEKAGHYEESTAAMRQGMGLKEGGLPNVSQTINLAETQLRFGHFDDALATLSALSGDPKSTSPYGNLEMRFARGCAAARAGKGDPFDDLAYAKAHPKDHPQALADLLLCVGDLDGAATAFIARLDDPLRRSDALLELSDYDPPVAGRPADPVYARLADLRAREDVKAAIARAGGIRSFNIQRPDL